MKPNVGCFNAIPILLTLTGIIVLMMSACVS